MSVNLSPVGGAGAQFCDNNGNPLSGGKLYTYGAGTTTPAATYTSAAGSVFHPNPIVLNAGGRVPDSGEIWLADNISYKFVLKTSADVLIATWDNINGINSNFVNYTIQEEVITATAGQTVFDLTTITYAPGTNSLAVYIDGVNQIVTDSYIETDANTVTFVSGLHDGALVKFTTAVPATGTATTADLVTYNPPFTGAVAESVEAKLAQTISVKDFGAVGDGVTDDTAAIQAAFDAVYAAGGGTVTSAAGKLYKITSTLNFYDKVAVDFNNSWVFNYSGTHAFTVASGQTFVSTPVSNVTVTYQDYKSPANPDIPPFTFDYTVAPGNQIKFDHITAGFVGAGVRASTTTGRGFLLLNRVIVQFHYRGFWQSGWGIVYNECEAHSNPAHGFYTVSVSIGGTSYPPNAVVYNCCTGYRNGIGVQHDFGNSITMIHPDFENNRGNAILLRFAKNVSIISPYTEYGEMIFGQCENVKLISPYLGGNAESAVFFATAASMYYTATATGGQTTFTVSGISGFSTMASTDVQVRVNNQWKAPTTWSKSGSDIIFTSGLTNGDIVDVIGSAMYAPSFYQTNDNERYPIGRAYNVVIQSCTDVEIETAEFDDPILDAVVVNDAVFGTPTYHVSIKPNVYRTSRTSTTVVNNTRDRYLNPYESTARFEADLEMAGPIAIKSTSDSNLSVDVARQRFVLADDATTTLTLADNGFGLAIVLGPFGAVLVSASTGAGSNIGFAVANSMVSTGSTNPDVDGDFNIYSAGSGVLGFKNRLGYSTAFTVVQLYV